MSRFFSSLHRIGVSHCPRPDFSSLWHVPCEQETWPGWWPRTPEQSVRKEITHNKRTHAVKKHLGKSFWHLYTTCDANISSREQVDPVVLNIFLFFFFCSGDAWLNNLIPLTWQAAISYRLYEKVPSPAFNPLVTTLPLHISLTLQCATHFHLVHGDKFGTSVNSSLLKLTQMPK